MSEENASTPDGGGLPATPPATPPAAPPSQPADSIPALLRELVDDRRELRKMMKDLQGVSVAKAEPPKAAPAPNANDVVAEITRLRSEMAFKEALSDAGVTDSKHKGLLTRLYNAEQPQDVNAWIEETVNGLGFGKKAAQAVVTPPIAPSNTGAPVRGQNPQGGPVSIKEISEDDVRKMSPQQIHESLQALDRTRGTNPYRDLKRTHDRPKG